MVDSESQYWDAVGDDWSKSHPDALWRAHSDAVNCALLDRWLGKSGVARLLKTDTFDEASTQGLYPRLAAHARQVIGIDISVATLLAARRRHPGLLGPVSDVRCLPFADQTFDVIISNSTLDHFASLAELEAALAELHRVMRNGGQLILTLDNPINPMVGLRNALPFHWLRRIGIVPYFVGATCGPSRLRHMLDRVGFQVSQTCAILHCPRVLAVALARRFRNGSPASARFLRALMSFERLSALPTRFITGHFTAVLASRQ